MNDQKSFEEFELVLVPGSRKAAAKSAGAGSRDLWQIPRDKIRIIPNFNPRMKQSPRYIKRVRVLADSMKSEGFYQSEPIEVYVARMDGEDVYMLTDGHRRLDAYDLATSEGEALGPIPAVPCAEGTTLEDLTFGFVQHNNNREELTPYELGITVKRLVSYNVAKEAICKRLDISPSYHDALLLLVGAERRVREMVINEEVVAADAIEVLRKHGAKAFEVLQAALAKAQAVGKARVSRSLLPHVAFKRSVEKAAPNMFATLREVRSDPAFASIEPTLREKLVAMLADLDKLEADANTNAAEATNEAQQALVA